MIPLQLQLKNFMSYGDDPTDLDFTGMHTICLSGENGHGKSALLDAMTWALWGETRLGKQNHDQLIRLGADEMWIILTFEIAGQLYRVRRQRSKRSAGQIWELQQDDGGGGWRSLTGTGTSDTGRAIQHLLRMSYDTFLNSAYLRQGRADEFVRQTANKRKEILCEILDLGRYDELEARARIKMRDAADRALDTDRRINLLNATIGDEARYKDSLTSCLAVIEAAEAEREKLTVAFDDAKERHAALKMQQARAQQVEAEIRGIETQLIRLRGDEGTERGVIEKLNALISQRDTIVADFDALVAARKQADEFDALVAEMHRLERERITADHAIATERAALSNEADRAKREAGDVARKIEALAKVRAEHEMLRPELARLEGGAARLQKLLTVDMPGVREKYQNLTRDRQIVEEKIAAVDARIVNLGAQTEACSVCGNPLPLDKIDGLIRQCDAERSDFEAQYTNIKDALAQCELEVQRIKSEKTALERDQAAYDKLREKSIRQSESLAELPDIELSSRSLRETLKRLEGLLAADQFAPEARVKLTEVCARLAQLHGTDIKLSETRNKIRGLETAERRYHELAHAEQSVVESQRRLAAIIEQVAEQNTLREIRIAERVALAGIDEKLKASSESGRRIDAELKGATERINRSLQERGRLETQIETCERARIEKKVLEVEQTAARRDEEIYKQLVGAFGKQGLQALIIENAVPEIESDANELLYKLTEGDMSIKIDTQKLSKTKGRETIESLEIYISDNLGTRPLELYSGGETFRVSFALRIALSKMLARRAGARLQTLIIDEGFGTQDAKGREKLVDAVHVIKEDFERIIVITHIDELKDAFPSRIEVVKTPMGSRLTVTEGGMIG